MELVVLISCKYVCIYVCKYSGDSGGDSGSSAGTIAGGCIGGIIAVAILVAVICIVAYYWLFIYKKNEGTYMCWLLMRPKVDHLLSMNL